MNYSNEQGNKDRTEEGINEKNMSEAELAIRLGWSKQYLNRIRRIKGTGRLILSRIMDLSP